MQLQDASNSVQIGHSGNNFFIKRGDNDGQIRFRNIDNTDPFIFDLTTATPVFTTTGTISSGAITSSGLLTVSSSNDAFPTIAPATKAIFATDNTGGFEVGLTLLGNASSIINFGDYADEDIGQINYSHSSNSFVFKTNATTALTLNSSQNATFAGTISSGDITSGDITIEEGVTPALTLSDTGNAGGGGASGKVIFKNTGGDAMGIGYTANVVTDSDMIISTNAGGTYGGYLGLDANGITDAKADIVLEPKTNVFIATGDVGIGQQLPKTNINTNTSFMPVDSNGKFLTLNGGANGSFIMLESSTTTNGDQLGGLFWTRTGGQSDAHKQVAGIDANFDSTSLGGGQLRFFTKPVSSATATPRMQIDQAGNIKVGTTIIIDQSRNLTNIGNIGSTKFNINSEGGGSLFQTDGYLRFANGNTETVRIDNAGRLLIGTTSTTPAFSTGNGHAFHVGDASHISRSGGTTLIVNRGSSDGNIVDFRKDGTQVGVIGTKSGDLIAGTGDTGIRFDDANNAIYAHNTSTNAYVDDAISLGFAGIRFKDLHLSGTISSGNIEVGTSDTTNGTITIHGGASGNAEGGEIRLQTSADHDGTYDFYRVDVNQDDFRIGRAGTTDFYIFQDGLVKAENNFQAGGTGNFGNLVNALAYQVSGTQVISSARNLENIGTYSGTGNMTVAKSTTPIVVFETSATSGQDATLKIRGARTASNTSDIATIFFDNKTSAPYTLAKIIARDPSANHGLGNGQLRLQTSSGGTLSDNIICIQSNIKFATGGQNRAEITSAGVFNCANDVAAFGTLSDITLKENIKVIENPLDKVKQIRGVNFSYKKDGRKSTGLIAQELEKVLPNAIFTTHEIGDDEEIKAIRYGNVVGLLVEAIKEQQEQIDELKAKLDDCA